MDEQNIDADPTEGPGELYDKTVEPGQREGAAMDRFVAELEAAEVKRAQVSLDAKVDEVLRRTAAHGAAPQPSVARIVHFVQREGRHVAAVIVGVNEGETVDLHVFPYRTSRGEWSSSTGHNHSCVESDQVQREPHTWHWPERE